MSGPLGSSQWMYASGYEIEQSLRLNDDDTAYFSKTFSSAGNRRTWTLSAWVKRSKLGAQQYIWACTHTDDQIDFGTYFGANDRLYVTDGIQGGGVLQTTQVFRDTSAWLHIVWALDTTQSTVNNRIKIYVNGVQVTDFANNAISSGISQNEEMAWMSADKEHRIGRRPLNNSAYLDGYIAEFNFVDGLVKAPADFGETGTYGEWKPIEYAGSYGTNGFYLPFENDYTVEGFSAATWKGNGVHGNYIGGVGFKPDFTWVKMRSHADNHVISDSVRGHSSVLYSNLTNAETTSDNFVTARSSDGFSVGTDPSVNYSSGTHVAWNWDMGNNTPTGFSCVLSTGNATVKEVGGVGFQPDLVINETRSAHQNNFIYDAIRGPRRVLRTNHDVAEADSDALAAFRPDGFMRGSGNDGNENNVTYVDWCWNMGGTSAANTTGDINSTVMANTTYGQSIVSYTGNGSAGQTVGHGLSSAPEMIWVKNTTDIDNWCVYCKTGGVIDETDFLRLDTTMAVVDDADRWNDTAATSSVFTVDTDNQVNGSNDEMIAYCWHSVSGYSKIGSYSGDGTSDGSTVISCGFRPAWVMIKCINDTESWWVWDNVRNPFTNTQYRTAINSESTETSNVSTSADNITFTSTGFALTGSGGGSNQNGNTYIFMAFAGGLDSIAPVNTTGSIDSRVKANTTYGQSIVSYTGNGSDGATVGHGLSSAPDMVIVKDRDSTPSWSVGHVGLGTNEVLLLNQSSAKANCTTDYSGGGVGARGSSHFTLEAGTSNANNVNNSGNKYIAYCFHSVTGYSKFGSYTGNGSSTGPSVTTGFKPGFIMIKCSSSAGPDSSYQWVIADSTRSPTNTRGNVLKPNVSDAESDDFYIVDFNDTSFQIKETNGRVNANGETYIYMAFADTREYAYWLDQSGNNNDWTSNNLTESDISVDSPTNNFAAFNPLKPQLTGGTIDYFEGNLHIFGAGGTGGASSVVNTQEITFDVYFELYFKHASNNNYTRMGLISTEKLDWADASYNATSTGIASTNMNDSSSSNQGDTGTHTAAGVPSLSQGDILQVAYSKTNGKLYFGKNGTWTNSCDPAANSGTPVFTGLTTLGNTLFFIGMNTRTSPSELRSGWVANFGQDSSFAGNKTAQGNQDGNGIGDFFYEPPTGFLALCTKNLPSVAVTPSGHFHTAIYTGVDGNQTLTGFPFQPDWTWIKSRSNVRKHYLVDAVRGYNKPLNSNLTSAEGTDASDADVSPTSDGLQLDGGSGNFNAENYTYVAWNWKANGSGSSNTNGSITSTVSANTDAGFSIVSYTGTGSNATVGHGLTSAPGFIVIKTRNNTGDWMAFYGDNTDFLKLNETNATEDLAAVWNDTSPTSSVFSLGSNGDVNTNGRTYIAYCFHSVDGYSKVGSYIGNGNTNGTFVHTSFAPAYILWKNITDAGTNWVVFDNKRDTYNPNDDALYPNASTAEEEDYDVDFLSNGFKFRNTSSWANLGGKSYIYMAFAETPFKYSNAR